MSDGGRQGSYRAMGPVLEDGLDVGVWLEKQELPPLLPADTYVAIFVHPVHVRRG